VSGALPGGLTLTAASGAISGTPTASGAFPFSVTVKDSAGNTSPAQSLSITIGAGVTITTTSLPNGTVGVAYGQTLAASGGAPPYSNWTVVSGALPGGLTLTAASGAIGGTPTASGAFPFSVTVKDSAGNTSPAQSLTITITVQPVQGLTVTQNGGASAPNQTNLLVSFGQAAQSTYTGTLSASFQPDPSVTNVPANYIDPAGGFPVSAQSTALTQNFTMSPGATQSSIQFGLGTVAGTWTVILTSLSTGGEPALPTSPPSCTVPVAAAAPSITAGSVQIVNLTSSGFSVQLTGFATTRDVSSAAFVFTAAAGAQLQGTTVTVPFNGQDQSQWFDTTASLSAGGTFSLLLPFGYSGDPSALGSVAATLTNSRGQTSASVTGAP
jgi:Rieske Fe-S protein